MINDCKYKIENSTKEKRNKINEFIKKLNKNKNHENENNKKNISNNEKEKELESNINKYIKDINEIIERYKEEINLRKNHL